MCIEPTDLDQHRRLPEWDSQLLFGHRAAVSHDLILPRLVSVPHYQPLPSLALPLPPPKPRELNSTPLLISLSSNSTDLIS